MVDYVTANFSANLGFLWTELSLPEAIRAAAIAGFSAVECHWPYHIEASEMRRILDETGLSLISINTIRGDVAAGELGLAAVPGRKLAARASIDQAIDYAVAVDAQYVHVMSGLSDQVDGATETLVENLQYAIQRLGDSKPGLLIEPINHRDIPDYFLHTLRQARHIVEEVNHPKLGLMFDCYHNQITEGDLLTNFTANLDIIRHVQIASVPSRSEPDEGEVAYRWLIPALYAAGYSGFIGAEYRPRSTCNEGLGWLTHYHDPA
jgi:2-dehydrotetronate isomerase